MPATPNELIQQLNDLKNSPGWKIIVHNLKGNVKDVEDQMTKLKETEKDPVSYMAGMNALLDKKSDRETLMELPEILIEQINGAEGEIPEFDPYYTSEQIEQSVDNQIDPESTAA